MSMTSNPNSMLYWWPLTKALGIPVPRTEVVYLDDRTPEGASAELLIAPRADDPPLIEEYSGEILAAAQLLGGLPLFLRTDLTSGKHEYSNTCHVPDGASLMAHVGNVLEFHELALWTSPDSHPRALVLRELLDLDSEFIAFSGLPIGAERRYRIDQGRVTEHWPYWLDEDNIRSGIERAKVMGISPPDFWLDRLRLANWESPEEIEFLTSYAQRVANNVQGSWSVDFARTRDGTWYLIDMALASHSWWPGAKEEGADDERE